jgi:hypothetical protein
MCSLPTLFLRKYWRYKNSCKVLINFGVESKEFQMVYVCCLHSKEAQESSWHAGYR